MTQSPSEEPVEDRLNRLVDAVPVIRHLDADKDDAAIQRLIYDLATGMYGPAEIARRYGLGSDENLLTWLEAHPQVVEKIKQFKAAVQSDKSVQDRLRLKSAIILEEALPSMSAMMNSSNTPVDRRLDAMKQLSRMAGVDGLPPAAGKDAVAGTAFVVNFMFSKGAEQISATVVDAIPAPDAGDDE